MTIKKRTIIKKRRVVRRTVSSSRPASKPKLYIIKTPRRGSGRKLTMPMNLPEQTHQFKSESGPSDGGWRRA